MTATDLPFGPGHPEWCPNATDDDPGHCMHWWDCEPCCRCGDDADPPRGPNGEPGCDCPKHHPELYDDDGNLKDDEPHDAAAEHHSPEESPALLRAELKACRAHIEQGRAENRSWMNGVADVVESYGYNREAACGPADLLPGLADLITERNALRILVDDLARDLRLAQAMVAEQAERLRGR